jgi:putative inorganic carbon (HCO3(-)) transporter
MIQAGIVVIVAWGALAFGAVYSWAYLPLLTACVVVGLLGLAWGRHAPTSRADRATIIALLAVMVAGLAQLIPLPAATLKAVSPATDAFLRHHDLAYALETARHPLSIDPRATVLGLAFLGAFVVFLAGLLRIFARSGVTRLVPALVTLGVVLAVIAIVQKAVLGDHTYMGMKIYGVWTPESKLVVPFGPYVNRNHFAGWMLMAIPLAIGYLFALLEKGPGSRYGWRTALLWFSSPQGGRALLATFAVVVMTLSLAMSMSRSGMACLALAALLVGWRLLARLRTSGTRLAAGALFVLLIAVPALWVGLGATVDRFSADPVGSIDTRLHAWRDTRAVIRDFPMTGTGLNTFGTAMVLYQSGTRGVHFQESHNDYLQLAAEGGLLLGIPILLAALLFLRTLRRRFRDSVDDPATAWIRFGAAAGVLAVALQSFVEFSLQMPGNAALFVVLLGIAMHRPPSARPASRPSE